MRTQAILRCLWVGAAISGLVSLPLHGSRAAPPESALAKPARADQEVPATRPVIQAVLKDGKQIEGHLFRFAEGVYTIRVEGKYLSVLERDIEKLTFRPADAAADDSLEALVKEFGSVGWEKVEPLIPRLAAKGPAVIDPLLALLPKNNELYQSVGKVFQQIGPEIYPQLIERVRKDTSGWAAYPTWWALRKSGAESYPILKQILVDKDPRIRRLGCDVLYSFASTSGGVVPKSFVPALVALLDDPDANVSEQVPHILAAVESEQVVPALLETLKLEKRQHLHTSTILGLKSVAGDLEAGDADLKRILAGLADAAVNSENESVRGYAVSTLGGLAEKRKDSAVLAALKRAASDKRESVRNYAEEALSKFGVRKTAAARDESPSETMDRLISELTGKNSEASSAARSTLEGLSPDKVLLEALMQAVRDDEHDAYWPSVAHLVAHWDEKAQPLLGRYAKDEHWRVRRTVAMAWAHMKAEQLPDDMRSLARDSETWVRTTALDSLATLSKRPFPEMRKAIVPLLIDGLGDDQMHREYWWRIADALRECGLTHPEVVPGLVKLMRHSKNEGFRQTAAGELGELGYALRADDPNLSLIVKALVQALADEADGDTRVRIIWAMAYMGSKGQEALPALKKAQDDPYEGVAKAADEAVKKIMGGKDR